VVNTWTLDRIIQNPRLRPLHRAAYRLLAWRQRDTFAIDIDTSDIGFFGQLNWCLYSFAHCEAAGLRPSVRLVGHSYSNLAKHDWLHDYFEDVTALGNERAGRRMRITHIEQTDLGNYSAGITLERANGLLRRYLRVRPSIQRYVDDFVAKHFAAGATLGAHYRGTDKSMEATPVPWESYAAAAERYAARDCLKVIFVASDDPGFSVWMAQRFAGRFEVVAHDDQERSDGSLPIHRTPTGDRQLKGFEALVNCLLLSRCDALIRSASFLSGWSSVFNPALPVTMLNKPFESKLWFPDREVVKRSDESLLSPAGRQ
jgi:Nodulation protein Z (NodZ)